MNQLNLQERLLQCRRMFIKRHEVMVRIGVHDFEQAEPQRILIDVDAYVPLKQSQPKNDQLEDVVDYDFIRHVVASRIARGHINLQETLCDDVAQNILDHPQVVAVRVSTCKPDVYEDCDAVGVEILRIKEQLV